MRLTILGSGSPEPHKRRASSGYLLETGGQKILLDCGGGVVGRMIEAGIDPSEIDYLFFTHLHSDHMIDYGRLIHAAWEIGDKQIRVFGPAPLAHIHERLFGVDGALAHDLRARTEFAPSQAVWKARGGTVPRPWPAPEITEIAPGFAYEGDGWRLSSCEVPHAQPHLTCMAFQLEAEGKRFVYSGDAGICDPLRTLASGADLLLHWCYRGAGEAENPVMAGLCPDPAEIGQFAAEIGVGRLLLTHFRVHMDEAAAYDASLRAVRAAFGPGAEIAEDLATYTV